MRKGRRCDSTKDDVLLSFDARNQSAHVVKKHGSEVILNVYGLNFNIHYHKVFRV